MARDPVCGMAVDEGKATLKAEHEGAMYYFCSNGCMQSFRANPGKYAART